jgi:hypothetical protein
MGLRQAVELVLEGVEKQLEASVKDGVGPVGLVAFLTSVRLQLKLALTASDDPKPDWRDQYRDDRKPPILTPGEVAERDRAVARATDAEEKGPMMVQVNGGPDDGTFAPVDREMPVGAKVRISGVYELKIQNGTKFLEHVPDAPTA